MRTDYGIVVYLEIYLDIAGVGKMAQWPNQMHVHYPGPNPGEACFLGTLPLQYILLQTKRILSFPSPVWKGRRRLDERKDAAGVAGADPAPAQAGW